MTNNDKKQGGHDGYSVRGISGIGYGTKHASYEQGVQDERNEQDEQPGSQSKEAMVVAVVIVGKARKKACAADVDLARSCAQGH